MFRHLFGDRPPVLAVPSADLVRVAPARTSMPEQPVIGYLGGVTRRKGLVELVEAVALLRERGIGVRARIFGIAHEPEFRTELDDLVAQRGLDGVVEFRGEWPDPYDALGQVDLVAVPSWQEAFGRVPLEAACAGVPVVYSDTGGMGDYMTDGITGVATRPRDPHSLADGLQRVIEDGRAPRPPGRIGFRHPAAAVRRSRRRRCAGDGAGGCGGRPAGPSAARGGAQRGPQRRG